LDMIPHPSSSPRVPYTSLFRSRHWRASLYRIDESVQLASLSFVSREMQARLPVLVEEGQCLEIVQLSGQSAAEHFEKLLRRFGSALGEIQQVADGAICVL